MLHQVGGLEVLVRDRVVLADELECALVVNVLPLAPDLLMRLGQDLHRLAPALAALLPARDPPLGGLARAPFGDSSQG
jgi:hypothetical protein